MFNVNLELSHVHPIHSSMDTHELMKKTRKNGPRSNPDTIKIYKYILEDNYLYTFTQIKYLKYKEIVCFI